MADTLPCGCLIADNLYETTAGRFVLLLHPAIPRDWGNDHPATVWCGEHGWVHLDPEQYDVLFAYKEAAEG